MNFCCKNIRYVDTRVTLFSFGLFIVYSFFYYRYNSEINLFVRFIFEQCIEFMINIYNECVYILCILF